MDTNMLRELIHAILQSRQLAAQMYTDSDITIAEFAALARIAHNKRESEDNIYADDLQGILCISKPAISQMLKSLETRGYIQREINLVNRRKLTVMLTPQGQAVLRKSRAYFADLLADIVKRFGEEKTRQLIALNTEFFTMTQEAVQQRPPHVLKQE